MRNVTTRNNVAWLQMATRARLLLHGTYEVKAEKGYDLDDLDDLDDEDDGDAADKEDQSESVEAKEEHTKEKR